MSEPLDVNQLIRKGTVELGPEEHVDERAARLRREERHDRVELIKGTILFAVVLTGMTAVAAACGYVAFFAAGGDEPTRLRAHTLFVSVVTGAVAFLFGRSLPKS